MSKEQVIDYVMTTPGNPNKMVLEGMLGDTDGVKLPEISEEDEGKVLTVIDGKWDKGVASSDAGYGCKEEYVTLTDESVTTSASTHGDIIGNLVYSTPIVADTIKVTFNGVEYICQRTSDGDYGAPFNVNIPSFDWSEYPFNIVSEDGNNILAAETAGTYQVKIETFEESVETSECFKKAVKSVSGGTSEPLVIKWVRTDTTSNREYYDARFDDVDSALKDDRAVYVRINGNGWYPVFYASSPDDAVLFYDYRKGKVAQLKRDTGSDSHLYIQTESPK